MSIEGLTAKALNLARKTFSGAGHAAIAATAGAIIAAANFARNVKSTADEFRGHSSNKKTKQSGEVVVMKKSTLVALLVALATVAGVLGALYVYVIRREKELDEYEQLLFSEDFNDDVLDEDEPAVEE